MRTFSRSSFASLSRFLNISSDRKHPRLAEPVRGSSGPAPPRVELLNYRRLGDRILQQLTRHVALSLVNGDVLLVGGVPQRLLGIGTLSLFYFLEQVVDLSVQLADLLQVVLRPPEQVPE